MENNSEPLVSVIVLTYNQESMVAQTIESILSQRVNFVYEIIIGEDASPSDNTRAVCEAYVEKYPNIIRLMPKTANKGLMRNYSDCIKACRGRYIAECAGDDRWHNDDKLQMQVDYLESHSGTVLVYTNYDVFQPARNKTIYRALPAESLDATGITEKLMRGFFLPPLTIMYRKSALQYVDFEMFIERGYMTEDLPMFLEFSLHRDFACIDVSTATYRDEVGSICHSSDAKKAERFLLNVKQIKLDFIASHPGVCKLKVEEIEEVYSMYIFRASFSLLHRGLTMEYSKKLTEWSLKNRIRQLIVSLPFLWWCYVKLSKFKAAR